MGQKLSQMKNRHTFPRKHGHYLFNEVPYSHSRATTAEIATFEKVKFQSFESILCVYKMTTQIKSSQFQIKNKMERTRSRSNKAK